jgi:formate-dependent nitrite reductase membrane component NrfD
MSETASGNSYYGQPVLKEPVWTWEIPCYFFTGGLAGASAGLGCLSAIQGNRELERRAWLLSMCAVTISPALLISDLGRPARFLNMLRMFKVTSPMSVGSWILMVSGTSTGLASAGSLLGWFGRAGRIARPVAGLFGLPLATYTAALVSNTAIPVWHEARRELPLVFAAGSAASSGGLACALTATGKAGPARRLAIAGAVGELIATSVMERSLGELGEPYHEGRAGRFAKLAKAFTAAGAGLMAVGGHRRRSVAALSGLALAAGSLFERWSIFSAGFQSAADPRYTVGPQRERINSGESRGGSVRAAQR